MAAAAWRARSSAPGNVRPGGRAGRSLGRREDQAAEDTKVDPALAERARKAAERVTGFPARIVSGRLEIAFTDETELAELVEALERLG